MDMEIASYTVAELLELYRNKMLQVNAEYQRGAVWSRTQQKKLIDSVMRGYPLPLIYLHHIKKTVAGMQREDFEIIDGQQRINALYDFAEGAYRLLDPVMDADEAKFPEFLKKQPCPWGRQEFGRLDSEWQLAFLGTSLAVARVVTSNDNEARDLFIRLQSGLPLNSQETRDAWPGAFTDFVLKVGGKPQISRYPGHEFFRRVLKMKPEADRGKSRQLAAQMAVLFLTRKQDVADGFVDINSRSLDDFYYTHIDFDQGSPHARRLVAVLDKLTTLFVGTKRPKMKGHEAIHLMLLVDSLIDEYSRGWEDRLVAAHDRFMEHLAAAARMKDSSSPLEFWTRYGQWTRVNSDRADRIRLRHAFYVEKMVEYLQPLDLRDKQRGFGTLERELVYYRDRKRCAVCGSIVAWEELEIHHVDEHARGGRTAVENAVVVHQSCHPRGQAAIDFARAWNERGSVQDGQGA